ncbi:MAG: hypothetical protein LBO72_04410 [Helicobacteraceae bacterium]|jgi:hypothetical protein|nr:hypothetical protein [Helicobacteraceae bacterium]
MSERGYIEVHIESLDNSAPITPESVDIAEIVAIVSEIEKFLGKERPKPISYNIADGSIRHLFRMPIIAVITVGALLVEINKRDTIDFLDTEQAKIIDKWQHNAKDKNLRIIIGNSLNNSNLIIDRNTQFYLPQAKWIDAEVYLYGKIDKAGGKTNATIDIETKDGIVKVEINKQTLADDKENRLYKVVGVRARGKQNLLDGSLKDLKFIEYIPYSPSYDKEYLDKLIKRATKVWSDVSDVNAWLNEIRGREVIDG